MFFYEFSHEEHIKNMGKPGPEDSFVVCKVCKRKSCSCIVKVAEMVLILRSKNIILIDIVIKCIVHSS